MSLCFFLILAYLVSYGHVGTYLFAAREREGTETRRRHPTPLDVRMRYSPLLLFTAVSGCCKLIIEKKKTASLLSCTIAVRARSAMENDKDMILSQIVSVKLTGSNYGGEFHVVLSHRSKKIWTR